MQLSSDKKRQLVPTGYLQERNGNFVTFYIKNAC